jgi:hypothetical protein
MRLLSIFRRRPIREAHELAQFVDANASFLVQKGIFEYSRARAGHYAKVLFTEPAFIEAVDRSRWQAYPLGLAMVGEAVEGALLAHADGDRQAQLGSIEALVLSVFDGHPIPTVLGYRVWSDARSDLRRRLQGIGLHPPKRVMDIPEPLARTYFELMPIHAKLRGSDYPTIKSYLRIALCNIHAELMRRMDGAALGEALRQGAARETQQS